MKRTPAFALVMAALFAVLGCGRAPEPVLLSYFFLPLCPTCPETAQMDAIAGELAGIDRTHEHVTVQIHNLRHEEGSVALREAAGSAGADARMLAFPVLFENGSVHAGFEEIADYLASW